MAGLIGRKIRMTQVFGADGSVVPVTAIETGPCVVVQKKEMQKDGYNALQLGFGRRKNQRMNKPQQGHMGKLHGLQLSLLGGRPPSRSHR